MAESPVPQETGGKIDSQAGHSGTDEDAYRALLGTCQTCHGSNDGQFCSNAFHPLLTRVLAAERAADRHGFESGERNIKLVAENAELESLVGEIVGHIADHQHPAYQAYLRYVRKEEAGRG